MLPLTVAHQLRRTLLDYLRTTFGFTDRALERALFEYLQDPEHGLFKGPYVDLELPFRKLPATAERPIPLDVAPAFAPYAHQLRAFERLSSRRGHTPESTLITTGTGSGKTECFLYPILDHCQRHRGEPGIKAILLYPMNALATDQAARIAKELWNRPELKQVSAGLYVGGHGSHGASDEQHLIDKRDLLRQSPPDILLTNYRMLDYLLMRPADAPLWHHNGPETLRYLVLDELHTYDGAQGSDVACLIRRLKARLGTPSAYLTCVGTSATIGAGAAEESREHLVKFAEDVFGEALGAESLIGEDRYQTDEVFPPLLVDEEGSGAITQDPLDDLGDATLDPSAFADPAAYLRDQARAWLGLSSEGAADLDALEVGERLSRHVFLRRLLEAMRGRDGSGGPRLWTQVASHLAGADPRYAELDTEQQWRVLSSFLSLIAFARSRDGDAERPFLTVQAQLWVRELRGLVRRVEKEGQTFAWRDELEANPGEHFAPVVFCRECGADGLGALEVEGRDRLVADSRRVGLAYLQRAESARYLRLNEVGANEDGQLTMAESLCPACLDVRIGDGRHDCQPGGVERIPVAVYRQLNDQHRFTASCPTCGADNTLRLLGSRAASLSSVAISHLFHSPFQGDMGAENTPQGAPDARKLLAFTDSVQDASHRAGFFAGRTYRFNLRTAMYSTVSRAGGSLPLTQVAERMLSDWALRLGEPQMVAAFMPPDLREHEHYVDYMRKIERAENIPKRLRKAVLKVLTTRLSWEVTREFGHAVTIGRSLDSTACASLSVDVERLNTATTSLADFLREQRPVARPGGPIEDPEVAHFLEGLIQRMRVRGGIFHPLLDRYVREGNPYLLSKRKNPLFSPHHRNAVPPRFFFDGERHKVFDPVRTALKRHTWLRDWTARSLKCSEQDAGIAIVVSEALERLLNAGVVAAQPSGQQRALGLNPDAFAVTTAVGRVHCSQCHSTATLDQATARRWENQTCTHYGCKMSYYEPAPEPADHDYYRGLYRSGRVHRIFTGEHTGLLTRAVREKLELDFKSGVRPDAPNLLTCTPTLEMGIDIGDLESVMLCSVPPRASNYLQRIGRAGRASGNALVVTVAGTRPHDLYFHREPEVMLRGEVRPPGCFLDASAMLQRQMVAHAMDRWASAPEVHSNIPHQMRLLLGPANAEGFPKTFVTFYEARQNKLTLEFLSIFGNALSNTTRQELAAFGAEKRVPERMLAAFDKVRRDRSDLKKRIADLKARKKGLEADPSLAQLDTERGDSSVEEAAAEELADIEDAIHAYRRVLDALGRKHPLEVLCDESVLPNYAFPEPGVTLKSILRRPRAPSRRKQAAPGGVDEKPTRSASLRYEYMRPASAALREFAPFNTFYAEGHKVRIGQVDVGSKQHSLVHGWRFCPKCACSVRLPDARAEAATCPRCGEPGWADAGQLRDVVHFQQAWSSMNLAEATTADESEEREEQGYRLLTLVDVPEDLALRGPAWLVEGEALLFGYELLRKVEIRQLNLGRRGDTGHEMHLAGSLVSQQGFTLCEACGKVQDPRKPDAPMQHAPYCRSRIGNARERVRSVYLARGIRSEALRVLLPVSNFDLHDFIPSFEAALSLGLRKHFGGQPQHLRIESTSEPSHGDELQFVVMYDTVPGGTGYLADLAKRENFRAVIAKSYAAMRDCSCAGAERYDGCYRCVYAYQSSRTIPHISRRRALEVFARILHHWDDLGPCKTLSNVDAATSVESELEMKFLAALKSRVVDEGGEWSTTFYGGKECFQLQIEGQRWRIEPQVEMRAAGITTRPDFMLKCLGRPELLPTAIYCDGFRYHVQPERERSRLGDDIEKRRALLEDERCWVFSVTWKDIEDFESRRAMPSFDPLFPADASVILQAANLTFSSTELRRAARGAMDQIYDFVKAPDLASWRRTAAHAVTATLDPSASPSKRDLGVVWDAQEDRAEAPEPVWPDATPSPTVLAGARVRPSVRFFAQLSVRALRDQDVGKAKVLLRLEDTKTQRTQESFRDAWRSFLQAWNVLQFHELAQVVSYEWLSHDADLSSEPAPSRVTADQVETAATLLAARQGSVHADDVDLLADFPEVAGLLACLAAEDLPMPREACFTNEVGATVLDTALAWPELRLGLIDGLTDADRSAAERADVKLHDLSSADQEIEVILEAVRAAIPGNET